MLNCTSGFTVWVGLETETWQPKTTRMETAEKEPVRHKDGVVTVLGSNKGRHPSAPVGRTVKSTEV